MAIFKKIIITLLMVLLTYFIFNCYNKAHCMGGVTNVVLPGWWADCQSAYDAAAAQAEMDGMGQKTGYNPGYNTSMDGCTNVVLPLIAQRQAAYDAAMAQAEMDGALVCWPCFEGQEKTPVITITPPQWSDIDYKPGDNPGNSQDSTLWPDVSWDEESGELVEKSVVKNHGYKKPSSSPKGIEAVSYHTMPMPVYKPGSPVGPPEDEPIPPRLVSFDVVGKWGKPIAWPIEYIGCNTILVSESIGMPNPCWPVQGNHIIYKLVGIAPGESIPCPFPPVCIPGRKAVQMMSKGRLVSEEVRCYKII